MKGDTQYHPEWHSYRFDHGTHAVPTSAFESLLWKHKDKAFFALIGAISQAIELGVPTQKQLRKWSKAVRCERLSDKTYTFPLRASEKALQGAETLLAEEWKNRWWFSPSDITGTNIPGSGKYVSLKWDRKTNTVDATSLLGAYMFSLQTCPLFVWQFFSDVMDISDFGSAYPDAAVFRSEFRELIKEQKSNPVLIDEAEWGCSSFDAEAAYSGNRMVTYSIGFMHSVGNIGFLQKPGGKLRTVANPNRLVQYANIPLGTVLSRMTYGMPGSFVTNQEAGMRWAQEKLRQGITLSSFDMSSATDKLDYQKFIDEYFVRVFESDKYPLLKRSFELFSDTSSAPWTMSGACADLLGSRSCDMSWTVGQPLGLRPSFPVLTLMNSAFAIAASGVVDGNLRKDHYACVGDDLIIEARYADAYMDIVRKYNGEINNEKTLESNRYAEFCSHLVTTSSIYPLKPRWHEAFDTSIDNIERFTTSGLRPDSPSWVRNLHDDLASYSLDGFHNTPYRNVSRPKPLIERLGVNALISLCQPAPRDLDSVSLQTLVSRALREGTDELCVKTKDLMTSWASGAYEAFCSQDELPVESLDYRIREAEIQLNPALFFQRYSSLYSTSVELPVKREWDYRRNEYVATASQLSSCKKALKNLKSVDVESYQDLVSATMTERSHGNKVQINLTFEVTPGGQAVITYTSGSSSVSYDCTAPLNKLLAQALYPDTQDYLSETYPSRHSIDIDYDAR
jgi:hypothetical protein